MRNLNEILQKDFQDTNFNENIKLKEHTKNFLLIHLIHAHKNSIVIRVLIVIFKLLIKYHVN